jgi:hypothetical protein
MNGNAQRSATLTARQQKDEWAKCAVSFLYFVHCYCYIYDATNRTWVPFHMWPAQARTAKTILNNLLTIVLKARQLGLTWLVLAFALWLMLFHPIATVLIFSKRDDEAVYLLGTERLRGMYRRLPDWMQARAVEVENDHEFALSNGSIARAFPTSAGDSYTATLVIVDEADLVPNQSKLLDSVKPTIDGGGRMIMLSRADKDRPITEFKMMYKAAKAGNSPWANVFLPWYARPTRDAAWYERQKADVLSRGESLDSLYAQYPATDTEALAANTANKRIPPHLIEQCYIPAAAIEPDGAPVIPGLTIYRPPAPGQQFVAGVDPAEGNPTSDDSAATWLDLVSGEEVASLAGKFQPSTLAAHVDQVSRYFNAAPVLVERNNHGHAVLLWLGEFSTLTRLDGTDGKPGWQTNAVSKATAITATVDALAAKDLTLHNFVTVTQLQSIDGSTLAAPEGQHDDQAMTIFLAQVARNNPAAAQARKVLDAYKQRAEALKRQGAAA